MNETAIQKRLKQQQGVIYGCHVDLDIYITPDNECVLDYNMPEDCTLTKQHRSREACPYWREIKPKKD